MTAKSLHLDALPYRRRWAIAILCVLPVLLYARALGYGLLGIDDSLYYLSNEALHGGHWRGLYDLWRAPFASEYFPVTDLTLWLDLALFGQHAWTGARIQQLLWFIAGVLAVRALVFRLTEREGIAFAAALLYAVHPVCQESVLWLAQRKNLVAFALAFWSLERYVAFRQAETRSAAVRAYAMSCALGIGALLAKSQAVCLPVLIAVYEVFRENSRREDAASLRWRTRWLPIAPFVAFTAAFVGANVLWFREDISGEMLGGSRLAAVLSSGPVALRYLAHTLWPFHLSFYYGVQPLAVASALGWGAWLLLVLVFAATAWQSIERRRVALGWSLGLAGLLPALNLIAQPIPMTDHYQHWALPGWIMALVLLVDSLGRRAPRIWTDRAKAGCLALAAGFAIVLVSLRCPDFSASLPLLQSAARDQPDSAWALVSYAGALHSSGEPESGEAVGLACLRAIQAPDSALLNPEDRAFAIKEAAACLQKSGRTEVALNLIQTECARIPHPLLQRVTQAEALFRLGDSIDASKLLKDDFEKSYAGIAAELRAQCRGGRKRPNQLEPLIHIQAGRADAFSRSAAVSLVRRELFVLAEARYAAGDSEGAFDAAAVLCNVAPDSLAAQQLLDVILRRLNASR